MCASVRRHAASTSGGFGTTGAISMRIEDPPEVSRRLGAGFFATSSHPLGRVDSGLLAFGLRLGPAFRCGSVSRFAGLPGRPSRALARAACL